MAFRTLSRRALVATAPLAAALLAAGCSDTSLVGTLDGPLTPVPSSALQAFGCTGSTSGTVSCSQASPSAGGGSGALIGGQNLYLKLTSSNVSYNSGTGIFSFDVTVQNLMNEAIGTPDGTTPDPQGIQVFFYSGPFATSGAGAVSVANADGTATFTTANQPFFAYTGILAPGATTASKNWQLSVPATVSTFEFMLYVETDVQPKLVINEIMANPGNAIQDSVGEYVEVYNAGTRWVNLNGFQVSDQSGTTENTPHVINQDVIVPAGGYVVLGRSQNQAINGGMEVDYVYVTSTSITAMQFSNSAGDVFRIRAPNGNVVDQAGYTTAGTSAAANQARELRNPSLDNSNIDGANWGNATTNYETTNRGTPGEQNSIFQP